MTPRIFAWCTYRDWSFQVLEGLLDLEGWRCGLVVTTPECNYDFSRLEVAGVPIHRADPRKTLKVGEEGFNKIRAMNCSAVFHYGWSWIVPEDLCKLYPNVTLHPGKLPRDRGGSPIQNQIRNGEDWSWANIIELVPGLDEGRVYARIRISLAGNEADDVWARMVASGTVVSRQFLRDIAAGRAKPVPQDANVTPTIYKRVTPEASKLDLDTQPARLVYDIIRAHNETDANSYVRPAYLEYGKRELVILRASLTAPAGIEEVWPTSAAWQEESGFELCSRINNGEVVLALKAADGKPVFATRCRIRCTA